MNLLTAGARSDCDGILEREVNHSFRSKNNLLAFTDCGACSACARAGSATDSCAFAAAKDAAKNGANRGPAANFRGRALALTGAGPRPLIGLNAVALAVHGQLGQLEGQD